MTQYYERADRHSDYNVLGLHDRFAHSGNYKNTYFNQKEMTVRHNQILIRADKDQKQSFTLSDGSVIDIVPNRGSYNENGRETNPVLAEVLQTGTGVPLKKGDIVLLHHNLVQDPVYQVGDISVIPYDRWTMATMVNGELVPHPDNVICERIKETHDSNWFVPTNNNRGDIVRKIDTGEAIGIRKWADYEVIYQWKGVEYRRIIVWQEDVVCKIK